MSNTRHVRPVPPAFGGPERSLAEVVGETVALHSAGLLGELLARMPPARPECFYCVADARRAVRAYEVACKNATQAGEPVPDAPPPPAVAQAITWVPHGVASVPACWEHVDPAEPASVPPQ